MPDFIERWIQLIAEKNSGKTFTYLHFTLLSFEKGTFVLWNVFKTPGGRTKKIERARIPSVAKFTQFPVKELT